LNRYLEEIDSRITAGNYEGAVTLAYTSLEGCLKAFLRERCPELKIPEDVVDLAKIVRSHLRDSIDRYQDEALAMLTHIAHMIDRTRNRFSESHFDEEADVACRFRSRSRKFRNTSSFALHEKSDRPGSR